MFTFVQTEDGSPTVRILAAAANDETLDGTASEAMHSLKGAFSETVYIYGTAIETALKSGFSPRVLSMGLGLGYVEILATALFLREGADRSQLGGVSFEIVPELRNWFNAWVLGEGDVPAEFRAIYDQVLARTADYSQQSPTAIRALLSELLRTGAWEIREALTPQTEFTGRFGCICFDAFSSKSTPDLWTEEFLKSFLLRAAEASCVLSTYACTGALKRSLRESGFRLEIREGFSSKRDSTFAVREASAARAL